MGKLGFGLHERVPSDWGVLWVHVLDWPISRPGRDERYA